MKNYFEDESGNAIVPFNIVSYINSNEKKALYVYIGTHTCIRCSYDQLDDYINWLDMQYKKDLAITNLINPIENLNRLTKEHIKRLVNSGIIDSWCDICTKDYNLTCKCSRDFEPTDEFVEKVNNILEDE